MLIANRVEQQRFHSRGTGRIARLRIRPGLHRDLRRIQRRLVGKHPDKRRSLRTHRHDAGDILCAERLPEAEKRLIRIVFAGVRVHVEVGGPHLLVGKAQPEPAQKGSGTGRLAPFGKKRQDSAGVAGCAPVGNDDEKHGEEDRPQAKLRPCNVASLHGEDCR